MQARRLTEVFSRPRQPDALQGQCPFGVGIFDALGVAEGEAIWASVKASEIVVTPD